MGLEVFLLSKGGKELSFIILILTFQICIVVPLIRSWETIIGIVGSVLGERCRAGVCCCSWRDVQEASSVGCSILRIQRTALGETLQCPPGP